MEEKGIINNGVECNGKRKVWESCWVELVARIAVVLLTGVATVLMATTHDVHNFDFGLISIRISAHYSMVRALVFFVYGNAIVAIYSILVTITKFAFKNKNWTIWLEFSMDQVMAYMVAALVGASIEVLYIAKHGEDKVLWAEVCSNYRHFCTLAGISILFSIIAVFIMAALVVISSRRFFLYGKKP